MSWKWAQIVDKPLRALVPIPFKPSTSLHWGKYPALITMEGNLKSEPQQSDTTDPQPEAYSAILKALDLGAESTVILNRISLSKIDREVPDVHSRQRVNLITNIKPRCLLRVTSYMVSDVILIQATTIWEAADQYLEWLESCEISIERNGEFPDRQSKPYAVVTAGQVSDTASVKALISARYCEAHGVGAQDYIDLERSLFAGLVIIAESDNLNQVLASMAAQSMGVRDQNHHLWSTSELLCLLDYAIGIFSGNPTNLYNSVQALSPWNDLRMARDTLWPELMESKQLSHVSKKFQVKIFSQCLSRYANGCVHREFHTPQFL